MAFYSRQILKLAGNHLPGQLVVQYTDECNASCPQCGMRKTCRFTRSKLGMETCRRIIEAAAARGFASISFTGGEPLLYLDEITLLLRYARMSGIPYTRTGTNGFLFMDADDPGFEDRIGSIAGKLAQAGVYTFWISIDSPDASLHEKLRGLPGVIEGIRRALPIFHRRGVYPSANLGINKSIADLRELDKGDYYQAFRTGFMRFYEFVISLGFTIVNACYPMNISGETSPGLDAVYQATSDTGLMRFSPAERAQVYRALFDTIPEYRHRIRIFSPRCSLFSLMRGHEGNTTAGYPCRGGIDFFFIDARRGDTYPCGYRGSENLGKLWDMNTGKPGKQDACRKCDWECFRDPSEMMGPFSPLFSLPVSILKKLLGDREFLRLWVEDWKYYQACGFFDCRRPPDYRSMARHSGPGAPSGRQAHTSTNQAENLHPSCL
jgi:sulfatase maturation enzyme AslB (radical SAM superfamily)